MDLAFSNASLDLAGCPAVGRCGPLITPNLYTPPGVALTVCDTPSRAHDLLGDAQHGYGGLAGELNEAYVYVKDHVLTLYAGKKIGDLVLSWVSQEQGDVQLIGYVEGAPPAPMANLTNKPSYPGATSLTLSVPTSVTFKLQGGYDDSTENKLDISVAHSGSASKSGPPIAPFGVGIHTATTTIVALHPTSTVGTRTPGTTATARRSLRATSSMSPTKYTVKLQGALAPVTSDQFMASLNSVTTQSTTVGTAASKRRFCRTRTWVASRLPIRRRRCPKCRQRKVRRAHVRAVAVRTGVRHFADAGRLPADAAADEHGLRLRSRSKRANPPRPQHCLVPHQ